MASEIDLRALRHKVGVILDHVVERLGVEKLAIGKKEDFYWDFNEAEMFDVTQEPRIVAGRVSDDVDFLEKMQDEEAVSLMLMHVAPLLRYIAFKIGR